MGEQCIRCTPHSGPNAATTGRRRGRLPLSVARPQNLCDDSVQRSARGFPTAAGPTCGKEKAPDFPGPSLYSGGGSNPRPSGYQPKISRPAVLSCPARSSLVRALLRLSCPRSRPVISRLARFRLLIVLTSRGPGARVIRGTSGAGPASLQIQPTPPFRAMLVGQASQRTSFSSARRPEFPSMIIRSVRT